MKRFEGTYQKDQLKPVIDRLERLVQKHYGCLLTYEELIPSNEWTYVENQDLANKLKGHIGPVFDGKTAHFPVRVANELVGSANIVGLQKQDFEKINNLQEIISLIITSTVSSVKNLKRLRRMEETIANIEPPENVISIGKHVKWKSIVTQDEKSKPSYFNLSSYIESENFDDILKMAIEIHEHSRKHAFLYFDDLNLEVRIDASEINQLGEICLFVPEVTDLKSEEQAALVDFFDNYRTDGSPQLIVGSVTPFLEVMRVSDVRKDLLEHFSGTFINMKKPFDDYRKLGLIPFFFDTLKGRPVPSDHHWI